jgi:hypothetical protein
MRNREEIKEDLRLYQKQSNFLEAQLYLNYQLIEQLTQELSLTYKK